MKNQKLLLAFAVVFGLGSNAAFAETQVDKFRTNDGAQCEQSYNTGRTFEFGISAGENDIDGWNGSNNSFQNTDDVEIFAKWTWELGRDKVDQRRINCQRMIHLEQHRMEMANERQALELELLRLQVEAAVNAANNPQATSNAIAPTADGDDW